MNVTIDYVPRSQFASFHARAQRFAVLVCHRRAGKTVACIHDLVAKAVRTKKKNARYAYVAPFYRQAKDVAWEYLKDATKDIAVKTKNSELRVELPNGAWITLYGADNPDALRGLYFDGVVLDEFGDCRPSLWAEVILPTLMDRKGWAVFIGTPKGKNHFFTMNERAKEEDSWFQMTLKASDSGILDAADLAEMQSQMTEEQYKQEMECDFTAAVRGTYYADLIAQAENAGRMGEFPWQPELPVRVSSDLGYTDNTALWFWQNAPDGIRMIDYETATGQPLTYYFDLLKSKGYKYEELWLPHDAKAKSLQTGRSTIEQFLAAGFPCRIVPKLAVQHGIDATRKVLPTVYFDQVGCFEGIEALRAYRRRYDEVTKQFSKAPVHDWASNGADAFRYFSLVTKEQADAITKAQHPKEPLLAAPEYCLEDLYEARDNDNWRRNILRI